MAYFVNTDIKSVKVGDTVLKIKTEEDEKKLKGYQYDSLVYRYIRAREKQAEYEYIYGKTSDRITCDERANRDIMRFCQILDEVIGEHE